MGERNDEQVRQRGVEELGRLGGGRGRVMEVEREVWHYGVWRGWGWPLGGGVGGVGWGVVVVHTRVGVVVGTRGRWWWWLWVVVAG